MKNLFCFIYFLPIFIFAQDKIEGIIMSPSSCELSTSSKNGFPLARVNDEYLMLDDVDFSEMQGMKTEDSLLHIQTVIRNWATQQLLIDGARINLGEEQQTDFRGLVKQYETDLYTSAYTEALVKRNLDTTLTQEELTATYNQNKEQHSMKRMTKFMKKCCYFIKCK